MNLSFVLARSDFILIFRLVDLFGLDGFLLRLLGGEQTLFESLLSLHELGSDLILDFFVFFFSFGGGSRRTLGNFFLRFLQLKVQVGDASGVALLPLGKLALCLSDLGLLILDLLLVLCHLDVHFCLPNLGLKNSLLLLLELLVLGRQLDVELLNRALHLHHLNFVVFFDLGLLMTQVLAFLQLLVLFLLKLDFLLHGRDFGLELLLDCLFFAVRLIDNFLFLLVDFSLQFTFFLECFGGLSLFLGLLLR